MNAQYLNLIISNIDYQFHVKENIKLNNRWSYSAFISIGLYAFAGLTSFTSITNDLYKISHALIL